MAENDEDDIAPGLFKKSTKRKKPLKVRPSFTTDGQEESDDAIVLKPKQSVLARQQARRDTAVRPRTNVSNTQSSYSSDYLDQLRASTPTVPREYASVNVPVDSTDALDVPEHRSKTPPKQLDSIPNESTIKYLKEAREIRRQAGENFIPLSDSLSVSHWATEDAGKRMQTEDQIDTFIGADGGEGLEGYESDTLPLGPRNTARAMKARQDRMSELIHDRETGDVETPVGDSGTVIAGREGAESSSDSDDEWERTQIAKISGPNAPATSTGRPSNSLDATHETHWTPQITTIPTFDAVMARLQRQLHSLRVSSAEKLQAVEEIERMQVDVADRESAIQEAMRRAEVSYATAQLNVSGGIDSISQL